MRTIARETASQVAPRNCSKEIRGEVSIYVYLMAHISPRPHTKITYILTSPLISVEQFLGAT